MPLVSSNTSKSELMASSRAAASCCAGTCTLLWMAASIHAQGAARPYLQ